MSVYPTPNFFNFQFGFDELVQKSTTVKRLSSISLYLYLDFVSFFPCLFDPSLPICFFYLFEITFFVIFHKFSDNLN